MSTRPITSKTVEKLTKAVDEALSQNALSPHLKKIWVFQEKCFVADFSYRGMDFGINIWGNTKQVSEIELVARGRLDGTFTATPSGTRKETLATQITHARMMKVLIDTANHVIARIDDYHADTEIKEKTGIELFDDEPRPADLWNVSERLKVGVITLPLSGNYGGNLQAFSLMQILRELGCEPLLLNRRYAAEKTTPGEIENTADITNEINMGAGSPNTSFIEKHIAPISRTFRTSNALRERINTYKLDAVISGSDQVWRPKYARGLLMDMFHAYLPADSRDIKRISYAASFGADTWEYSTEQTKEAQSHLKLFDAVSVREDSAADFCRETLGVAATHVLDPTLLLTPDHFRAVLPEDYRGQYSQRITSYILDPNPQKQNLMEAASKRLSTPVLKAGVLLDEAGTQKIDKSVEGWIAAFYNADFVFTDSYHGVAFAILFNKPFIAFGNPQRGLARFSSILKIFGLEDRFVMSDEVDEARFTELMEPINWTEVNKRLAVHRRSSLDFLSNALALPLPDKPPQKGVLKPVDQRAGTPGGTRLSAATSRAITMAVHTPKEYKVQNPLNLLCTGCGVCVSESDGALKMVWTDQGFLEPKATGKVIPSKASRVCPFNATPDHAAKDEDALGKAFFTDAKQSHPRGGIYINSYVGHSPKHRASSSSGGLATYIFEELLEKGHVDYLYVVQEAAEKGYSYAVFDQKNDINRISKTRYFPVTMESLFDEIETRDGTVAISGVGCFLKAIRLKQHYHPALRNKIKFLTGIICGGLKSRHYTEFLSQTVGVEDDYGHPDYREKNPEGQASDYFFSLTDTNRKQHRVRMRPLGDMWGSGLFKNKACDYCTDVLTELGDISLGDAWLPEYNKDGMGSSVVVTRSALADQIIQQGIASGNLEMEEVPIEAVIRSQSGGLNHKQNALMFRRWMMSTYSDLKAPHYRTRVEKEVAAADIIVQILRERVRSKSLSYWTERPNLEAFNTRMRSSRRLLANVTAARRKHAKFVYKTLISILFGGGTRIDLPKELAAIACIVRWLTIKQGSNSLNLLELSNILPDQEKIRFY